MALASRILRKFRGYILPSHLRTFREVIEAGRSQPGDEKKQFVFFDFTNPEIDLDAGRYIFALVRDFEECGFISCYRRNFPFLSNLRYKRYKSILLERPFRVCNSLSGLPTGSVAAVVTDRKRSRITGTKIIRVLYDERLPRNEGEVSMPFPVYPKLYEQLRTLKKIEVERERPWRCFFAGTVTEKYGRDILPTRFGKMSRLGILKTLKSQLSPTEVFEIESGAHLPRDGACVVLAGKSYRVPLEQWFPTLAQADFFLACPGGSMPLCHNLIEAMAVGTIPILEYPEYLDPALRDGVNCLAFSGAENLIPTARRALELKPEQIRRMREAVCAYFRHHLAPGLFARWLMKSPMHEIKILFKTPFVRR